MPSGAGSEGDDEVGEGTARAPEGGVSARRTVGRAEGCAGSLVESR